MADKQKESPPQAGKQKDQPLANGAKATRQRSPNYPTFDLRTAVERCRTLFGAIGRHSVGAAVVVQNLGFSAKSSSGLKALAALRAFGLLEDVKEGGDVRVRLSERALDIVVDYSSGQAEWTRAVHAAALAPAIHRELWNRYDRRIPPDDELRRYLVRVRESPFNDNSVADVISEFKSTIAFSGLSSDDKIDLDDEQSSDHEGVDVEDSKDDPDRDEKPKKPNVPKRDEWAGPVVKFDLPRGNQVEIRLRSKLSPNEFKKLKQIFDLSELAFVDEANGGNGGGND
jgi:hypothetical protein